MHRIGIDARMAEHTGIGRYIRGTFSELKSPNPNWTYTLIAGEEARNRFPRKPQFQFVHSETPIYSIREQFELPKLARFCDLLHIPHHNAPLLWRKKLVVTIHDLIHIHFKKYLSSPLARFYATLVLPAVVRRADAIIAVSEHT